MNTTAIDTLATKLANAAMVIVVRTCRNECRHATKATLDAVCAAMRAKSGPAIDKLLRDAREAPSLGDAAFQAAALEIAEAGIAVLRNK